MSLLAFFLGVVSSGCESALLSSSSSSPSTYQLPKQSTGNPELKSLYTSFDAFWGASVSVASGCP